MIFLLVNYRGTAGVRDRNNQRSTIRYDSSQPMCWNARLEIANLEQAVQFEE
jgi:hypothetical protein